MLLCFKLSMPCNNSWNGKWTGSKKQYVKIVSFQGKRRTKKAHEILNQKTPQHASQPESGYYSYNFGDGWVAGVSIYIVDGKEAARLRRQSAGFCGYEWMIDSIIENLDIRVPQSQNT